MSRSASPHNALRHAEELRYRMPAEWEPHEATWLAWPHNEDDWPGKFEPIAWVYAEIIRNLSRHERVELIVNDAASGRRVRKILGRANAFSKNVRFHRWATDRIWLRDSGCIFVDAHNDGAEMVAAAHPGSTKSRQLALTFCFNAWAKYSNYRRDQKIGGLMARHIPNPAASEATRMGHTQDPSGHRVCPVFGKARVVLEGGSIDVNGCGSILTTEECLLSKIQQRNPRMSRKDYEKTFADYLGAENAIWLGKGIAGDDTHGHVDDLARFVAAGTIVTVLESNPKDINHKPLRENLHRLKRARDQSGKPFTIAELPMPRPVVFNGRRLPASYANFYIANRMVLVPVFNDPCDRVALNTLSELFPSREIVPIYAGDLVWGFGTIHCMTQQQPRAL